MICRATTTWVRPLIFVLPYYLCYVSGAPTVKIHMARPATKFLSSMASPRYTNQRATATDATTSQISLDSVQSISKAKKWVSSSIQPPKHGPATLALSPLAILPPRPIPSPVVRPKQHHHPSEENFFEGGPRANRGPKRSIERKKITSKQ